MLEQKIFSAVLNNDEESIKNCASYYGIQSIKEALKGTRLNNASHRLLSNSNSKGNLEEKEFCRIEQRNSELLNDFASNLSRDLHNNNIDHVFFKGSALSLNYYDYKSDRPYSDFDILLLDNNLESFYKYLDLNQLSHKNNRAFLSDMGYTRTALEVINTPFNVSLDFHYRIISKFKEKYCRLTKSITTNKIFSDNLYMPAPEEHICIILYHAFIQNDLKCGPYFLVDIHNLLQKGVNNKRLESLLKNLSLYEYYKKSKNILDNTINQNLSKDNKVFIYELFRRCKKNKKLILNSLTLKSQLYQLLSPKPYLNYSGAIGAKNIYYEFFKRKLFSLKKRVRN